MDRVGPQSPLWLQSYDTISNKIAEGWNVNSLDDVGLTLLLRCISTNRMDIVTLLLQNGADPNLGKDADDTGRPLKMAVRQCNYECVESLIAHGATVQCVGTDPDCLKPALYKGTSHLVRYLLDAGLNHRLIFDDKSNLLNVATRLGNDELVEHILSLGCTTVDVNNSDPYGHTCIFHSVVRNKLSQVSLLLKANAAVNVHDTHGIYLLAYAIVSGNYGIVAALIDAGADMEVMDTNQLHCNAAQLALSRGQWEMLRLFVRKGVTMNSQNARGESILDSCWKLLQRGVITPDTGTSIFKFLVDHGANVESMQNYPFVPQGFFVQSPRRLVDLLLNLGLRPIPKTPHILYQTPLREAYMNPDTGLIRHLVEFHHFDINMSDNQEDTISHKAARDLALWRLKEFAELGADFDHLDTSDISPLQYSVFEDQITDSYKFLIEKCNTETILNSLQYIVTSARSRYEVYTIKYLALNLQISQHENLSKQLEGIASRCNTLYQSCITELHRLSVTYLDGVPLLRILKINKYSTLGRNLLMDYILSTYNFQEIFPLFWLELLTNFKVCADYQAVVTSALRNFASLTHLNTNAHHLILDNIFSYLSDDDINNLATL
ncbi:hypothetical protein QAD02_001890 [Eretmocerus hayati]|uniref:Uncharacterized protein n=1 Tax=Eretmocerus hayati TaxID=131215 RepID=A0ACC2NJ33_9HYME|nr:hypothetical protein QAD02_001890 [Eretmocerus hayati]